MAVVTLSACGDGATTGVEDAATAADTTGGDPDAGTAADTTGSDPDASNAADTGEDASPTADAVSCVPDCDGKACGDDGCGGSCAPGCATDQTCSEAGQCEAVAAACPATGPFGTEIGDTIPDVELMDCDGNPVSLHDLCDHQAGYFFLYAGW